MTEDRTKAWMRQLVAEPAEAKLPELERIWALRRLEEEFELRRRDQATIGWWVAACQGVGGLVLAVVLTLTIGALS